MRSRPGTAAAGWCECCKRKPKGEPLLGDYNMERASASEHDQQQPQPQPQPEPEPEPELQPELQLIQYAESVQMH